MDHIIISWQYEYMQRDNQLVQSKRVGQGWMREAAAQQKVTQGGVAQQQAMRQTANEQEANGKRGAGDKR